MRWGVKVESVQVYLSTGIVGWVWVPQITCIHTCCFCTLGNGVPMCDGGLGIFGDVSQALRSVATCLHDWVSMFVVLRGGHRRVILLKSLLYNPILKYMGFFGSME